MDFTLCHGFKKNYKHMYKFTFCLKKLFLSVVNIREVSAHLVGFHLDLLSNMYLLFGVPDVLLTCGMLSQEVWSAEGRQQE